LHPVGYFCMIYMICVDALEETKITNLYQELKPEFIHCTADSIVTIATTLPVLIVKFSICLSHHEARAHPHYETYSNVSLIFQPMHTHNIYTLKSTKFHIKNT
jgi:hypothetical protein